MKKLLSLLLALVLVFGVTACAPKAETPPPADTSPSTSAPGDAEPGEEKVLRVAMECAYAPYNWTQSDDANGAVPIYQSSDYANGYDVMMAKYLAEKIGYKLEIHKIDWDSIPLAVQSGKVDAGICGQSITAERMETMDFTTPYYYASIVALTTADSPYANAKGLSALTGATCTSQINTVWYDVCLPQIKDAKILPAMETTAAMLVALDSGKCNLVVTDEPTALAALMVYPNMKLLNFTGSEDNFMVSEEEINIGISLKKGNTELQSLLNEALATLTPDDFVKMMNEAITVQPLSE